MHNDAQLNHAKLPQARSSQVPGRIDQAVLRTAFGRQGPTQSIHRANRILRRTVSTVQILSSRPIFPKLSCISPSSPG